MCKCSQHWEYQGEKSDGDQIRPTEAGLCSKQGGDIIRKELIGGGISPSVAKAGICEAAWLEKPTSGKLQKSIPGRQK